jgi:hypothetical protein
MKGSETTGHQKNLLKTRLSTQKLFGLEDYNIVHA